MRSTKSSSASVGGTKMCSKPSRISATIAVTGTASASSTSSTDASSGSGATGSLPRLASGAAWDGGPGGGPADGVQRQPQPGRRVALEQDDAAAPQLPVRAGPARIVVAAMQRQHVGGGLGDKLLEPGQQRLATVCGVVGQIVLRRNRFTRGPAHRTGK